MSSVFAFLKITSVVATVFELPSQPSDIHGCLQVSRSVSL